MTSTCELNTPIYCGCCCRLLMFEYSFFSFAVRHYVRHHTTPTGIKISNKNEHWKHSKDICWDGVKYRIFDPFKTEMQSSHISSFWCCCWSCDVLSYEVIHLHVPNPSTNLCSACDSHSKQHYCFVRINTIWNSIVMQRSWFCVRDRSWHMVLLTLLLL